MFIKTLKFVAISIIFSVVLGGLIYLFIVSYHKVYYFIADKVTTPFKEKAQQELESLPENYTIQRPLLNATAQVSEFEQKVVQAQQNSTLFWILFGFAGFIVSILFYTGWTEVKKREGI